MPLRKRCVGFEDAFPGSRDSGGFPGLGGATKHFRVGRCSSPHPPIAVVRISIIRDEAACGVSRWKHGAAALTLHLWSSCGHLGCPPATLRRTSGRSRSIPRRPIEVRRTSVLRERRTFCVWHDDLITCEAGEAIRTSRGSRLCSYAKISLYHVYAACSTDHRGTRISSFRTEFFAPAPHSMTSGSMPIDKP